MYTLREEGTGTPLIGTKQLQEAADKAREREKLRLTRAFNVERTAFAAEKAALEGQVRILTPRGGSRPPRLFRPRRMAVR